jgi:hypothetical protein
VIEKGEEVQTKGICNIFNKISRKKYPFRYREPPGHQTNMTKKEPLYSVLKQLAQRTRKEY